MKPLVRSHSAARDALRHLEDAKGAIKRTLDECGARLPADVLGCGVHPCRRLRGHEGEHESTTRGLSSPVRWADFASYPALFFADGRRPRAEITSEIKHYLGPEATKARRRSK